MEKKLKNYLAFLESKVQTNMIGQQREQLLNDLLVQIGFFQHERLIHLIVTVTFAVLTMLSVFACLMWQEIAVFLLAGCFLVLLIPYIRHYYILENGVQKMYEYYDRISE